MNTDLTEHQFDVFTAIVEDITYNISSLFKRDDINDHLLSLSGAAGVGKSFLTTHIVAQLIQKIKESKYYQSGDIVLTAPTHKAVRVLKNMIDANGINAQCRTIHSFLNIEPSIDYGTGEEKFTVKRTKEAPTKASVLIVDESSMISKELYQFDLSTLYHTNHKKF